MGISKQGVLSQVTGEPWFFVPHLDGIGSMCCLNLLYGAISNFAIISGFYIGNGGILRFFRAQSKH